MVMSRMLTRSGLMLSLLGLTGLHRCNAMRPIRTTGFNGDTCANPSAKTHVNGLIGYELQFLGFVMSDLVKQLEALQDAYAKVEETKVAETKVAIQTTMTFLVQAAVLPGRKIGTLKTLFGDIQKGVCYDTVRKLQWCALLAFGFTLPTNVDCITAKDLPIDESCTQVTLPSDVDLIPSCAFIQFFVNGNPSHSMITYRDDSGTVKVAGTKNQFIGGSGGFKSFNLAEKLQALYRHEKDSFYTEVDNIPFTVHYRPIQLTAEATEGNVFFASTQLYKGLMEVDETSPLKDFAGEMYEWFIRDVQKEVAKMD